MRQETDTKAKDTKSEIVILVVDDDAGMRETMETVLSEDGYSVITAATGADALNLACEYNLHVILLDLRMPGMSGLELLPRLRSEAPRAPIIMMTAYGTIRTAVEAVKQGAYDFITKPFDLDEMRVTIEKALSHRQLRVENERLRTMLRDEFVFKEIVGRSEGMQTVFELIRKVMNHDVTVLIIGESGTGKELVARAIHHNSQRRHGPFLKLNCAALPDALLESELFGYEKGAFTGAQVGKPGRFELAHGGTLLLDEIGNMSQSMQAKLLRVLQEKEFERIGGKATIKVDVRILAATNSNLKSQVATGGFREDLYYRLNVIQIHVPPLRERKDDILPLIKHFIGMLNLSLGKEFAGVSPQAAYYLTRYHWPGNVRELKNAIEAAMIIGEGPFILPEHLPEEVTGSPSVSAIPAIPTAPDETYDDSSSPATLDAVEREHILRVLNQCSWNQSKAAWVLGVHRNTLRKKIREYKLDHKFNNEKPGNPADATGPPGKTHARTLL